MEVIPTAAAAGLLSGLAGTFTLAIPYGVWFVLVRPWKPRTRRSFAYRAALWPLVILSSGLAGPLARALTGNSSSFQQGIFESTVGLLGLSVLAAPIAFAVGWAVSARRTDLNEKPATKGS